MHLHSQISVLEEFSDRKWRCRCRILSLSRDELRAFIFEHYCVSERFDNAMRVLYVESGLAYTVQNEGFVLLGTMHIDFFAVDVVSELLSADRVVPCFPAVAIL